MNPNLNLIPVGINNPNLIIENKNTGLIKGKNKNKNNILYYKKQQMRIIFSLFYQFIFT
jgi:hypothetical protein